MHVEVLVKQWGFLIDEVSVNLTVLYDVLTKLQDEQRAMKERHENLTAEFQEKLNNVTQELQEKLDNVTQELEMTKQEVNAVEEVLKIGLYLKNNV